MKPITPPKPATRGTLAAFALIAAVSLYETVTVLIELGAARERLHAAERTRRLLDSEVRAQPAAPGEAVVYESPWDCPKCGRPWAAHGRSALDGSDLPDALICPEASPAAESDT